MIYCFEDKSQIYIPGIEGSDGFSNLTLSQSKRFLAICEKADRAICTIYDLTGINAIPALTPKRRKILTSHDYQSKEFVSAAFPPHGEKTYVATLTAPV